MFSLEIRNQIDIFFNYKPILWHPSMSEDLIRKHIEDNDKFFFYTSHEFYEDNLDILIKLIDEYQDKKIFISQPTTTSYKHSFNPIVSLLNFGNFYKKYSEPMKENIIWQCGDYSTLQTGYFNLIDEKNFKDLKKSNKGILSVRKSNPTRDYIFKNINLDNFQGIIRYVNLSTNLNTKLPNEIDDSHHKINKLNPTTSNLIKEYCKSFVSFVIETDNDYSNFSIITEKTIVPFLTQSLPIVYGGKDFIKNLEEMGFWLANKEFGFKTDSLYYSDKIKKNNFIEMIKKYNELSYLDIKKMYQQNYSKIKKNYDILNELYFSKKAWKVH